MRPNWRKQCRRKDFSLFLIAWTEHILSHESPIAHLRISLHNVICLCTSGSRWLRTEIMRRTFCFISSTRGRWPAIAFFARALFNHLIGLIIPLLLSWCTTPVELRFFSNHHFWNIPHSWVFEKLFSSAKENPWRRRLSCGVLHFSMIKSNEINADPPRCQQLLITFHSVMLPNFFWKC